MWVRGGMGGSGRRTGAAGNVGQDAVGGRGESTADGQQGQVAGGRGRRRALSAGERCKVVQRSGGRGPASESSTLPHVWALCGRR